MKTSLFAAALVALAPHASSAAELVGGSVTLSYSDLVNNDYYSALAKRAVSGSAEVSFGPAFSVQGDLAYVNFNGGHNFELDSNNVGLHAIYRPASATALGAFWGRDTINGSGSNYYGIEVGHSVGAFWGEAYFTRVDQMNTTGDLYGVSGRYTLNDRISFNAALDVFNVSYMNTNRASIGLDYSVTDALTLSGTIGHFDQGYAGPSDFISVGATFTFGPNKRATFKQRDLLNYLPGLGGFAA
ncbi:MAG: hypothetical protein IE919_16620 [Thioclava sp.]|nr:hypothetical protein [Thioclava sp.]MBD3804847.1 hypothetical protein [Thioclava sp.]